MKRVMEWTIGIFGYVFLWAAVGDKDFFSKEGLLIFIGGVLLTAAGRIGTAADVGKWPRDLINTPRS